MYIHLGFNSTMVRLKEGISMFQFHNGSIKRNRRTFQFHNGSIKRKSHEIYTRAATTFQFHNGSIKSQLQPICLPDKTLVSIPQWFD